MLEDIAGRDAELETVGDFLAKTSRGSAALVLEGEAGMGKTTLWRAAVEQADELELTVLQAQPVESETTLSFTGIADLLDPHLDEVLDGLAPMQRRALSRALALGDEENEPALDPRALRVAVMTSIRLLAAERPVLLAIDDSQWLDYASSSALAYGLRRFRTDTVGLLLSRRSGIESVLLDELLRSPVGHIFTRIHVDPLDVVDLGRVIRGHLGSSLPRPLLAEVHGASGGNPFYALEIVRMLQRTGVSIEAGQPLPLPESLHDLVNGRLSALSKESRDFLLAAAAHAHPTIAITEDASGVVCADGLEPALEARVVELDGERIRFTHPLLAAGVYEAASPLRRVEIHRRLAELLEDPEARAWQLAASVDRPDEGVAAVLEQASARARARGALRPAALLLDRASELTPDRKGEGSRRIVDAAYLHYEAGDSPRAEELLRRVVAELPPGRERARALIRLARVRAYEALSEAVELFEQAVAEAGDDPAILAVAHEGVAFCLWRLYERLDEVLEHSDAAVRLALELGDEALAGECLGTRMVAELLLGRETARETAERALALQPAAEDVRVLAQPRASVAMDYLGWCEEPGQARDEMLGLLARARALGDESSPPYTLAHLSLVECELGDLDGARAHALEGRAAAEQSGQQAVIAFALALEALIESQRGSEERTRAAAHEALRLTPSNAGRQGELVANYALGHLELALDHPQAVVSQLEGFLAFVQREAIAEPSALRFVVDYIEALVGLGREEEARELLDWYEGNARRLGRTSAVAASLRCRGLLAAQAGDLDAAITSYEAALESHATKELPLDRGRTLLALGVAQRRMKRRREARETLEEALATFERIGALLWAERARAELKRISGRAATPGALTPAEERVAALVAEGKTNREVAAALFLSERTVEGHLAHIFGKLGIRSRTEIASVLAPAQTQVVPAPNTGDSPVSAESAAP